MYGSYKGLSETKTGGQITIKALPLPSPDDDKPMITGDDSPIDPGKGDKVLKTGEIITVTKNYAETFDGNTADDWSRPNNAYLPKGTTDEVVCSYWCKYLLPFGLRQTGISEGCRHI